MERVVVAGVVERVEVVVELQLQLESQSRPTQLLISALVVERVEMVVQA
jgi:hypothetical protein